ncbi:paeninodin family lasso peptide [Virgibacillus flavescens]
MKKKWRAPVLETLDVSLTAKFHNWPPDPHHHDNDCGHDEEVLGDS